jgi:hypothetical protein
VSTGTGPGTGQRLRAATAPGLRAASSSSPSPPTSEIGGVPVPPLDPDDPFGVDALDLPAAGITARPDGVVREREIRPRRRLRWWQILPIALTGSCGSLMFAFPLAFESGDGGAVVGMLGLLLTAASVGWGAMAARRVGYAWPGLPHRGSGRRAGWRAVAAYTLIALLLVTLAVWRVARLRG